jgi:hypothetical protein
MPPRQPTEKELNIRARNRANARKSTGPRTAAGKRRSAMNALTPGLRAQTPRDEADVADRARRAALLADTLEPEDDFEAALVHRMASAFQRLEKADHLESQAFDSAVVLRETTPGAIVTNQQRVQAGFAAINRYRATAQQDLLNAYKMLEVYRHQRERDTPAPRVLPSEA